MTAPAPAPRPRLGLPLLFTTYLALVTWLVLWKLGTPAIGDPGSRVIKLVPFVAAGGSGASEPVELVLNLVIFLPFGVYLGLLVPAWPWWKVAGTLAGASALLEVAQYVLAVGSSDVTDVVVNTAGGLAGLGVVALARRTFRARTAAVMTRWCAAGTTLALLAAGLFVASPVRLTGPPPGDVVVGCPDDAAAGHESPCRG
ncbi:VanZ family protein [Krasilnikoviella flava]|uniref:VanZ like family protein n=1 Tax=Krasilnikoviella flava TaxID=526729 RepID=A0A1T5M0W0_9MICO|nr:VanZ family protein [Krasilnikoviella flava]SKC81857.1 VanZ like family protein [Krasilnikoviella flava]